MLRLYILRHAKAGWAAPGKTDFERSLNERGISDTALVAAEMIKQDFIPEKILCSPSHRTRETLEGVLSVLDSNPEVTFPESLYSGTPEDYLEVIANAGDAKSLMVVGHNPTCAILSFMLVNGGDEASMEILRYKYPTAGLTAIDIDANSWAELKEDSGYLVKFIIPQPLRVETG